MKSIILGEFTLLHLENVCWNSQTQYVRSCSHWNWIKNIVFRYPRENLTMSLDQMRRCWKNWSSIERWLEKHFNRFLISFNIHSTRTSNPIEFYSDVSAIKMQNLQKRATSQTTSRRNLINKTFRTSWIARFSDNNSTELRRRKRKKKISSSRPVTSNLHIRSVRTNISTHSQLSFWSTKTNFNHLQHPQVVIFAS